MVLGVIVAMMAEPPHQGAGAPSSWLTQDGTPTAITTLTFAPVADAQVAEDNPDFTYGTKPELLVKGGTDPEVASYLRFDVSGVSAPVQRATLRLWVRDKGGAQDGPAVSATDATWTETDLTWNTRPAPRGDVLADTGKVASNTWVEYDVTAAVRGDGPIAFVLVAQSADGAIFHSREAATPAAVGHLGRGTRRQHRPRAPRHEPQHRGPTPCCWPREISPIVTRTGMRRPPSCSTGCLGRWPRWATPSTSPARPSEFANCYDPTWGRHKSRTRPAPGNHEYLTSGATGYFGYFGAAAGDPQKGYYSYDLGSWHIVVLNSNCCQGRRLWAGSPQETWLRPDLAAHPTTCTLAYWHHPRFSFGKYSNDPHTQALWQALYEAGAEIVLAGHDHNYQRWTPADPDGTTDRDPRHPRVRRRHGRARTTTRWPPRRPMSRRPTTTTFGILQLTLHAGPATTGSSSPSPARTLPTPGVGPVIEGD